jgi:hypothetical protein
MVFVWFLFHNLQQIWQQWIGKWAAREEKNQAENSIACI